MHEMAQLRFRDTIGSQTFQIAFVNDDVVARLLLDVPIEHEEVADEMLAIQADRDKFVDKHINQYAQEVINRMYAERRLEEEDDE